MLDNQMISSRVYVGDHNDIYTDSYGNQAVACYSSQGFYIGKPSHKYINHHGYINITGNAVNSSYDLLLMFDNLGTSDDYFEIELDLSIKIVTASVGSVKIYLVSVPDRDLSRNFDQLINSGDVFNTGHLLQGAGIFNLYGFYASWGVSGSVGRNYTLSLGFKLDGDNVGVVNGTYDIY